MLPLSPSRSRTSPDLYPAFLPHHTLLLIRINPHRLGTGLHSSINRRLRSRLFPTMYNLRSASPLQVSTYRLRSLQWPQSFVQSLLMTYLRRRHHTLRSASPLQVPPYRLHSLRQLQSFIQSLGLPFATPGSTDRPSLANPLLTHLRHRHLLLQPSKWPTTSASTGLPDSTGVGIMGLKIYGRLSFNSA